VAPEAVAQGLLALRRDMVALEASVADQIELTDPIQRESARNLVHYLALRTHDIRQLQAQLAPLGLSSLGRTESHVLATIDAVLGMLNRAYGHLAVPAPAPLGFSQGRALLDRHARALLKAEPKGRSVRIMVTMPSAAATDYGLVRDLLAGGMDIMRINCAHDDPSAWASMVAHLRRAEQEAGKPAYILMDLAGPKLRTGPLAPGPQVVRWKPVRDGCGRVVAPARVRLVPAERAEGGAPAIGGPCLPVPAQWLQRLEAGDRITFRDARGSSRSLRVVAPNGGGWYAECDRTTYVTPGTVLRRRPRTGHGAAVRADDEVTIGALPATVQAIRLALGDTLILRRDRAPGSPATYDARGRILAPAAIGCTIPEVFAAVKPADPMWFDDGKIGGVISAVDGDEIAVKITHVRAGGGKLGADKGINVPETQLPVPALTQSDRELLPFVVAHADLVGLSFIRRPADVIEVQRELARLGAPDLGIVLKIETKAACDQLPALLLTAMRSRACGLMIARGDLAVECGYERMAELQEEILCIAEAAHMPVIWATQVLESLARAGLPTRAEITDAAMGVRAECVMLNKGPFIIEAARTLDTILRRMQAHQSKKSALLRRLRLAQRFKPGDGEPPEGEGIDADVIAIPTEPQLPQPDISGAPRRA
jgi:pyruvate kinase